MWKPGVSVSVVAIGVLFAACDDSKSDGQDTTPDVEDTVEVAPDTAPDAVEDTSPDTVGPDAAPDVAPDASGQTTWDEVHSIFATRCSPCHAGINPTGGAGSHAIASGDKQIAYDASQLDANLAKCAGKKVGECSIIRILDGSMPQGKNCGTNPNGSGCVSASEQALIQQWIQDGMLR